MLTHVYFNEWNAMCSFSRDIYVAFKREPDTILLCGGKGKQFVK